MRAGLSKKQFYIFTSLLAGLMIFFGVNVYLQSEEVSRIQNGEGGGVYVAVAEAETITPEPTTIPQTEEPVEVTMYGDENNYIHPYNLMSADWGGDEMEGVKYYIIPTEYEMYGGCLPEIVQVYTYSLCKEYGVDYPTVLALIERESKYKYDATGDDGASKGYMQVMEKWHIERMERLGVSDLYNPYHNILTGIDFLAEILEKYPDYNKALMVYNMGETGAKKVWKRGIYKSSYSTGVIERSQEIQQEIQD